jgi:FkbM family methyltransferase
MTLRDRLKSLIIRFGIPLTKNLKYDIITKKILRNVLKNDSNCIDIGCHKGEIMDDILKYAPLGKHYGFEPLPHLYKFLKEKYSGMNIALFPVALYDSTGETTFQYVVNAPAYSGIRKRHYDFSDPDISELTVEKNLLDNLIPENENISLIKIDVEGAEYPVMKGGVKTIRRCRPVIIFEFGIGAADCYSVKPEEMFDLLCTGCGMNIATLNGFLKNRQTLTREEFCRLYEMQLEYYFVACG